MSTNSNRNIDISPGSHHDVDSARLVWLLVFIIPITTSTIILKWQGPKALILVAIGVGLSALSTIAYGAYLSHTRKLKLIPATAGWGILAAVVWYIFEMFYFNADGDSTDIATGAGLVLLIYPATIVIFALLVFGAITNKIMDWLKNRFRLRNS